MNDALLVTGAERYHVLTYFTPRGWLTAVLTSVVLLGAVAARAGDALPVPWNGMDIGGLTPAGMATAGNGQSLTLTAGGTGLTGAADQFHFVFQSETSDFSLVARLSAPAGNTASAGLMAREALATTSDFVAVSALPGSTVQTQFRASLSSLAAIDGPARAASMPLWLRLVKRGERVEGYAAADRDNAPVGWKPVGAGHPLGTGMIYVGLWVAGGAAAFDHVTLTLGPQPLVDDGTYAIVPASAPSMALASSGNGIGLAASADAPNQKWVFTKTGGNAYAIRPAQDAARALSVAGGKSDAGTKIGLEPDQDAPSKRWSLLSNANGTVGLVPQCAPSAGLDDFGGDATPAARIDLWTRNESDPHLQWMLVPAP